jgi:hypothetical protein
LSTASQSSIDARVCSVSSNWTGLPVFFWMIRRTVAKPPADAQIVDPQTDQVAAPQLAVDRQVEHREVAFTRFDLKPGPDIPDFLLA